LKQTPDKNPHSLKTAAIGPELKREIGARIRAEISLVGVAGFEPATTRTPSVCATRLRYTPTASGARAALRAGGETDTTIFRASRPHDLQRVDAAPARREVIGGDSITLSSSP
jgi:hypothetical protein